jgi:phytoene dehydrogenase-like protein
MMELLRVAPMCVADWLGEQFETELLRCALAAPALDGTTTGPWSPGTVANLLRLETLAGAAVVGGPGALVTALEASARRAGVDIRTEAEVGRIRLDGGVVCGVTLRDGETLDARVVVSSCDPKRTFLELVEPGAIGPKLRHRIDKLRASGTTAKVDLAVRGELRFACRPDLALEHARIAGTIDGMERAFDAIKYGCFSESPILDVYVPTVANPGLAPDGHHVVSIAAHFAPYALRARWSEVERERLGDVVVETLGRYAPGIAERIVAGRVLAPVDVARRYGVTGGHIHHVEHALDQMIVRPVPECERHATPIPGLYLGGSGTHPGGGLTCAPGALVADAVGRGG